MIYCITKQVNYASSFNIFAVVAGIFLLRGNLKAARTISFFTGLFIACFTGFLIVMPFLFPFGLLLAYAKFAPITLIGGIFLVSAIMALLIWTYLQLTSQPVLSAMDESQINHTSFWRKPSLGFWIGGCFTVFAVVLMSLLMFGSSARQAKQKAADQAGPGYKFAVISMHISSSSSRKYVRAVVKAYNDAEMKDVVVEWSE